MVSRDGLYQLALGGGGVALVDNVDLWCRQLITRPLQWPDKELLLGQLEQPSLQREVGQCCFCYEKNIVIILYREKGHQNCIMII